MNARLPRPRAAQSRLLWALGWLGLVALGLVGCRPQRSLNAPAPLFVPPTQAPSPTWTPAPSPTAAMAAEHCQANLRFVADETIPDGSVVPPGAGLVKRWRVQNAGTCPWGPGYTLRHIAGPALGADETQPLFPAAPGAEAVLEVRFTAPNEEGTYQSVWQAFTPDGQPFGDPIYIIIQVAAPTETPSPTPPPTETGYMPLYMPPSTNTNAPFM